MAITNAIDPNVVIDYACMIRPKLKAGEQLTMIETEVMKAASSAIGGEIPEANLKSLDEILGMMQALASMR